MERAGEWLNKTGVFGVDMIRYYVNQSVFRVEEVTCHSPLRDLKLNVM